MQTVQHLPFDWVLYGRHLDINNRLCPLSFHITHDEFEQISCKLQSDGANFSCAFSKYFQILLGLKYTPVCYQNWLPHQKASLQCESLVQFIHISRVYAVKLGQCQTWWCPESWHTNCNIRHDINQIKRQSLVFREVGVQLSVSQQTDCETMFY